MLFERLTDMQGSERMNREIIERMWSEDTRRAGEAIERVGREHRCRDGEAVERHWAEYGRMIKAV